VSIVSNLGNNMAGIWREVGKTLTRSPGWAKTRREHLKKFPICANCGEKKFVGMQVHHIVPFHCDPTLELEPSNLITLCSNPRCHLDKGHLGYWKSWNVSVIEDCEAWYWKYLRRPL